MDDNNKNLPNDLIEELSHALQGMSYGSIELFVQDKVVTQITVRNIKKTRVNMKSRKETTTHIVATPLKRSITTQGKIQIKLRP